MQILKEQELSGIYGGKNIFKQVVNVVGGALFGGVVEGTLGIFVAGPAGFVIGFAKGAYDGAAVALIYEGGTGLAETFHPELGVDS